MRDDRAYARGVCARGVTYIAGSAGNEALQILVLCGLDGLYYGMEDGGAAHIIPALRELLPAACGVHLLSCCYPTAIFDMGGEAVALDDAVDEYAAYMAAQGGRFCVLGIALGGWEAIRLAARYPQYVDALALISCGYTFSKEGKQRFDDMLQDASRGFYEAVEDALVFPPRVGGRFRAAGGARESSRGDWAADPKDIAEALTAMYRGARPDIRRTLYNVQAPALVIGGSLDPFFTGKEFTATAAHLAGAIFKLYAGGSHRLAVEKSKAIAQDLAYWLRGMLQE